MMNPLKINIMDFSGALSVLEIEISATPPWTLKVSGAGFNCDAFNGDDLFDAMIALRRELERQDKKLLCAGARTDVYPSGMARSMGSARKAYVTKHGEPATELIDIFAQAEPDEIGTIDEQRAYHEQWFAWFRAKSAKRSHIPMK